MKLILRKFYYLLLLYPLVVLAFVVNFFIAKFSIPMSGRFLIYILIYLLAYFLYSKTLKVIYLRTVYVISLILVFFESAYILLYKTKITSSAVYILLETNRSEATEYFIEYFNKDVVILLIVLLLPSIFILHGIKKFRFKNHQSVLWQKIQESIWKKYVVGLILFGFAFGFIIKTHSYANTLGFNLYLGYKEYKEETAKYQQYFSNSENSSVLKSVQLKEDANKETLIITIGESTVRYNLGLYGYSRNTTPNLEKIQHELIVFKDVVSPYSHTIPVLEKVLTFGSVNSPEDMEWGSIMQLLNEAGYKTYWVSNQAPVGIYETKVALIAKSSNFVYYTNVLGGDNKSISLDGQVLPIVKRLLKEDVNKKVIFIHLMGTHGIYSNRYPKEFDFYKDKPQTNFPSVTSYKIINEYDNAVLYQDFILSELISYLKQTEKEDEKQRFLYFSDHGEEVYRTIDFNGHSSEVGTSPMYEIPFIFWSNSDTELNKYRAFQNRKYMTDNLIYSVSDLLDIQFDTRDDSKSIFSNKYKERKRIVNNNTNYDLELK